MHPIPYAELDTIFLDVGHTLVDIDLQWVAENLATVGLHLDVQTLRRAEAAAKPYFSKALNGRSTEDQETFGLYMKMVLGCLPEKFRPADPSKDEIIRAIAPVLRPSEQSGRLWTWVIPGVPDALETLKESGLRLIAVSNSNGTVEDILIQNNLRPYLAAVFDSHYVGFEKPDPRIFQHAIESLDLDPARILHVGDLYDIDVAGARAAGLAAVLIDPFGDWLDVDCERVRNLTELCQKVLDARCQESRNQ